MHLLLIRHGQTDENARGILQGHAQTLLNAAGREQARRVAERLSRYAPRAEAVVTSDLMRARETAEVVSAALSLAWDARRDWRERSFGPFEGRTIGEADIWRAANGHWDLPGAEPTAAFQERVRAVIERTARDFGTLRCLAVVTHGAVLRNVLNLLGDGRLRLANGQAPPASVPILNGAIMHLEAHGIDESVVRWRVHSVNDVDHLAETGVAAFRVEE
jgi:probable phosphoglycerate mutase